MQSSRKLFVIFARGLQGLRRRRLRSLLNVNEEARLSKYNAAVARYMRFLFEVAPVKDYQVKHCDGYVTIGNVEDGREE